MISLSPEIDFKANKAATPDRMNAAMAYLDARLRALETYKPNFDALFAQLQEIGLTRIDLGLQPVYQRLTQLAQLGAIFSAHSSTPLAIQIGRAVLTIDEGLKDAFAPAAYVSMFVTGDTTKSMSGRMASYDRSAGVLSVDVDAIEGTGVFSDWRIGVGADFTNIRTAIDAARAADQSYALAMAIALG